MRGKLSIKNKHLFPGAYSHVSYMNHDMNSKINNHITGVINHQANKVHDRKEDQTVK